MENGGLPENKRMDGFNFGKPDFFHLFRVLRLKQKEESREMMFYP